MGRFGGGAPSTEKITRNLSGFGQTYKNLKWLLLKSFKKFEEIGNFIINKYNFY